jgi:hypothetical protein
VGCIGAIGAGRSSRRCMRSNWPWKTWVSLANRRYDKAPRSAFGASPSRGCHQRPGKAGSAGETRMATKLHPAVAAVRSPARPRSRSRSATSTASCAASTCTSTSSSARPSPIPRAVRLLRRGAGLGHDGQLLRQHHGHRLAARLSGRAGAARPGHRAPVPWDATCRSSWVSSSTPTARPPGARARRSSVCSSAPRSWASVMTGMEFEWFNFLRRRRAGPPRKGVAPETLTPGMFGYSLLRMNQHRDSSTR